MKKIILILLSVLLAASPACTTVLASGQTEDSGRLPAPVEVEYEPVPDSEKPLFERLRGEWYADYAGLEVTLILSEDGAYSLAVPGSETQIGTWEAKDGMLYLDGDEENPLLPLGSFLNMEVPRLAFSREKPAVYLPADLFAEAREGSFDGYWRSHFTAVGGGTALSSAVGEDTELYIEGTMLATNGARFGLARYDGTLENGALTFASEKGPVMLQLQQDGFLRLTLSGEDPAVLYLLSKPVPDRSGEAAGT